MKKELILKRLQNEMAEDAKPFFEEGELQALHDLIYITVETNRWIQREPADHPDPFRMEFNTLTILSGVDEFRSVYSAYRLLYGALPSSIRWREISLPALKALFVGKFKVFSAEKDFGKQCRLLLDLFKIQLVLAGLLYGCEVEIPTPPLTGHRPKTKGSQNGK